MKVVQIDGATGKPTGEIEVEELMLDYSTFNRLTQALSIAGLGTVVRDFGRRIELEGLAIVRDGGGPGTPRARISKPKPEDDETA